MKLSVIMPVYNEANTVAVAIKRVLAVPSVHQLLAVDDGSTDKSIAMMKTISHPKLTILKHKQNKGKGTCIKTALAAITGDYVIINDADLEYDPADYQIMREPVKSGKAEVVYGSRFKGSHSNMFYWHYLGNRFLNFCINFLFNTTLSDMESCYKLIPVKILKSLSLSSPGFGFEPEVTCQLLKKGIHIYEVPISYSGRGYEDGKKLHWLHGISAAAIIIKERLT
ncbi:hypothetical protein A3B57_01785 [Microgenomates group bacterium RIFCSPLOWO2_01_FULL_47_10]|nr:MAG: hypothetical protein A3B57_01785 [Microgenomates group bacterium RIFCSPLOWO2_01_FULL_47_10]